MNLSSWFEKKLIPRDPVPTPRYDLAHDGDGGTALGEVKRVGGPIVGDGDAIPSRLPVDGGVALAVLPLPHLVLAEAAVLELGTVIAAAVREVVAGAGGVGAVEDRIAVAGARAVDLRANVEALFELRGGRLGFSFGGGGGHGKGEKGESRKDGGHVKLLWGGKW